MATSRFIDWLRNLTAKSTTIDGTEQVHIDSSGLSQKATTKDLISYVIQSGVASGLAQTWNAAGTTFTGLKLNITDTASAAASLLADLQVGGSSKFKVDKAGAVTAASTVKTLSTTVSALPSASTAGSGARAFVTDSNATTYLSTVAGGGSNKVPVVSDGTNWLIG